MFCLFCTHVRGYCELIVFFLELRSGCMVPSYLHVVAEKSLSVAVNPVKHLKINKLK